MSRKMFIKFFEFVLQVILVATFLDATLSQQTNPATLMISYDIAAVKIFCNSYHCQKEQVYLAIENFRKRLLKILPCECKYETNDTALLPALVESAFLMGFELTKDDNCFGPNQLLCGLKDQTSCKHEIYCKESPEVIALGKELALMVGVFRCVNTTEDPKIKEKALRIIVNSLRNFVCCTKGFKTALRALLRQLQHAVLQLRSIDNRRCSFATSNVDYCKAYSHWHPGYYRNIVFKT